MTITPDSTWKLIQPNHHATPFTVRIPPGLTAELTPTSDTLGTLVISPKGMPTIFLAIGVERGATMPEVIKHIESAADTTHVLQRGAASLAGKPGTFACLRTTEVKPRAAYANTDGTTTHNPGGKHADVLRVHHVPIEEGLLEATYRVPEQDAKRWVPVFAAVMSTLEWRRKQP